MESRDRNECSVTVNEPDMINVDGKNMEYSEYQKMKEAPGNEQHTG